MSSSFRPPTTHITATRMPKPSWHDHKHRLWDDFVTAVGSLTLSENDWRAYLESHDHDELPEVEAEIDAIKKLLEPEIQPLPDKRRKKRKKS